MAYTISAGPTAIQAASLAPVAVKAAVTMPVVQRAAVQAAATLSPSAVQQASIARPAPRPVSNAARAAASNIQSQARARSAAAVQASSNVYSRGSTVPKSFKVPAGSAGPAPNPGTPAPVSYPTETAYEPPADYGVPYQSEKPYLPPPEAFDPPGLHDVAPAPLVNTDIPSTTAGPNALQSMAVTTTAKLGLIDRILSFLGLSRTKAIKARIAGEAVNLATMSRTDAAFSLVRRARNGDQNAMAIMAAVRDRANQGDKQAEMSFRLMMGYIKNNPTDRNADMGAEDSMAIEAAVQLSHGNTLTGDRIGQLLRNLSPSERKAFNHGMKGGALNGSHPARIQTAYTLGKAVGAAKVFQGLRMKNVPNSAVNANIAWELGD